MEATARRDALREPQQLVGGTVRPQRASEEDLAMLGIPITYVGPEE